MYYTPHERDRLVAYHESGHAVLAHVTGLHLHEAYISGSPATSGLVTWEVDPYGASSNRSIITTMGGRLAEIRLYGKEHALSDSSQDFRKIAAHLEAGPFVSEAGQQAHLRHLVIEAKRMIQTHWHTIRAFAGVLLRERYLEGHVLRTVMHNLTQHGVRARV